VRIDSKRADRDAMFTLIAAARTLRPAETMGRFVHSAPDLRVLHRFGPPVGAFMAGIGHPAVVDPLHFIDARGGIVTRAELHRAGLTNEQLRIPGLRAVGRAWLATDSASSAIVYAAEHRAQLACVSAATHRGLAVLTHPAAPHHWARPRSHPIAHHGVLHRDRALLALVDGLIESVPDMLQHVSTCLPHLDALVIWESAVRKSLVSLTELRRIQWSRLGPRRLAAEISDQSDSLLETLTADLLRHAGLEFRQQVRILGHRVDLLVGSRVVVQLDGYAFHSGAAQRAADAEHDARLQLHGWIVLRFTYLDVVSRPGHVLEMIRRALAQ
jgi:very-short-patch-repair endonuclease